MAILHSYISHSQMVKPHQIPANRKSIKLWFSHGFAIEIYGKNAKTGLPIFPSAQPSTAIHTRPGPAWPSVELVFWLGACKDPHGAGHAVHLSILQILTWPIEDRIEEIEDRSKWGTENGEQPIWLMVF